MLTPLPLTNVTPDQGVAVMRYEKWVGKWMPACSIHGSMNRVSADKDWWRCLACNIGVEWDRTSAVPAAVAD